MKFPVQAAAQTGERRVENTTADAVFFLYQYDRMRKGEFKYEFKFEWEGR
jgi:hypothetical protein